MRWRRWAVGVLVLVTVLYTARYRWLPPLADWLNVSDASMMPVDIVVPLPGGNDDRPFAAAALVRAGLADQVGVLVNELTPNVAEGVVRPMHEVTREVLILRGVPNQDILMLPGTSNSTFSDIQLIGELLRRGPNATIAIVTAPSHTRRVRWTVDRTLPTCRDRVCVVATFNDTYDARIWWRSQHGLQATVSEYLKLIFYWLVYSSPLQRVFAVAALTATPLLCWWFVRRRRSEKLAPKTDPA